MLIAYFFYALSETHDMKLFVNFLGSSDECVPEKKRLKKSGHRIKFL